MKAIARAIVLNVEPAMLTAAGAIDRAPTIDIAVDAVSSHANAGFNANAARTDADTGSNTDTRCARANAWIDADAARAGADTVALPDAALRRAVCVAINCGFSR
jgi:hypothetical protein